MEYIKKAGKTPATGEDDTRERVNELLKDIESGGEARARFYADSLDGWTGEIVVGADEIARASESLPQRMKDDIAFAHEQVRMFAEAQLASMHEFETEFHPGVIAGQKLIPVDTAGCYIPGGRYAHIASAIMSVTTARVAGVRHVIACSPAAPGRGVHPAILHAAHLSGADTVLALGGVQGVASLAFGLFTGHAADILVGPGNRFVAEAKRILFGRVGIDLFAGPTEILVIADETADPEIVASDLVGQAEHGPDSPAWLVTTSRALAERVIERVAHYIERLGEPNHTAATHAWRDYGEVVVAESREEAAGLSDAYAPEHLRSAGRRSRLVARPAAQLRLALPRRRDHRHLRRQVVRSESHTAYQGGGALHRGPERRQIHQDRHLATHDPRRQPRRRPDERAHLSRGGHGRTRLRGRRPAGEVLSGRALRPCLTGLLRGPAAGACGSRSWNGHMVYKRT